MCADEVFSDVKSDHMVWGLAITFMLIRKTTKSQRLWCHSSTKWWKGGKINQAWLFLASLFLLNCASLRRLMDKKQGGRNVCSIQACAARWEHRIKPGFQEGIRNNIFLQNQIKLSVLSSIVVCIRLCQVYCRHECCLSGFELVEGKKKNLWSYPEEKELWIFFKFLQFPVRHDQSTPEVI